MRTGSRTVSVVSWTAAFALSALVGLLVARWRSSIADPGPSDAGTTVETVVNREVYPTAPTETVVTRPAGAAPEEGVDSAYGAAFDGRSSLATSLGGLGDGPGLADEVQEYRVRMEPILAGVTVETRSVEVDDAVADLEFRLLLEGSVLKPWAPATAHRVDGVWYADTPAACSVLELVRVVC